MGGVILKIKGDGEYVILKLARKESVIYSKKPKRNKRPNKRSIKCHIRESRFSA